MRGHWSLQPPPAQCPPRPGAPGPIPGAAGRGRTVVPPSQGSLDQISELSLPSPHIQQRWEEVGREVQVMGTWASVLSSTPTPGQRPTGPAGGAPASLNA